ncbi:MAG TPA: HEAT repeat domain-containing protein, partial [Pseudomonadota bacterium]|nr:HEAT repeat domain-containing protein [Pseudomonadota bacterium]
EKLCSFRFANLRHSGNLSLVAGMDDSGRMLCNAIHIVDKTPSGFEMYAGGGTRGCAHDIGKVVRDISGDGNLELVVDVDFTPFQGPVHCEATWPLIYAWTGAGYTNVSGRFKGFYEHEVESLNQQMAALPPSDTAKTPYYQHDCLSAEIAKIRRAMGGSPEAGLSDAIALARDADPERRYFAAALLIDIGTPDALKYLRPLIGDSDRSVADLASRGLSGMGGYPVPTFRREPLAGTRLGPAK